MRHFRHFWWLFPAMILAGCTSVASFKGLTLDEESVYVSNVPPLTQNKQYSCGAICVAAVAASLGVPPEEFRTKYSSLPQDLTGRDLSTLARELGLQSFAYQGSWDDLQQNLRKGRPVIVMIPQPLIPTGDVASATLLKVWNSWGPKPAHWVVVLGLTRKQTIIIHDPASGPITIKAEVFQEWWAKKDFLTVLLAPG